MSGWVNREMNENVLKIPCNYMRSLVFNYSHSNKCDRIGTICYANRIKFTLARSSVH